MLKSCIAIAADDVDGAEWDGKIFEIQWAINNSVHSVTKRTPFSLVHTFKRDGFVDNPLSREIRELNKQLGNVEEQVPVDELLAANRQKMANQFNKARCDAPNYNPGDLVLVRADSPSTGESRKGKSKYRGPYEVVKLVGNDRYLIQDIEGEQQSNRIYKGIIAVDRLKLVSRNVVAVPINVCEEI